MDHEVLSSVMDVDGCCGSPCAILRYCTYKSFASQVFGEVNSDNWTYLPPSSFTILALCGSNKSSLTKTVVSHSVTHTERRLHQVTFTGRDYEQSGDDVLMYGLTGKGRIWMLSIDMIRTIQWLPLVCTLTDMDYVVFHANIDIEWPESYQVPTFSYPCFVQLLSCYRESVLSGLVISIGGLQYCEKASLSTLLLNPWVDEDINKESQVYKLSIDILWSFKSISSVKVAIKRMKKKFYSWKDYLNLKKVKGKALFRSLKSEFGVSKSFKVVHTCTIQDIILYIVHSSNMP
ncbi:hypothetical protein CRYUN_Cryun31cG0008700 [Craigia yunnanensis]